MNFNVVKLARMVLKLGEMVTDKEGESVNLIYDGDLAEGLEVFIESEGELIPAPDGEYKYDGVTYVIASGIISEIIGAEPEDENNEDPKPEEELEEEPNEKDAEIEQLKSENEQLKAENEELKKQIAELQGKLEMSMAKPAQKEFEDQLNLEKDVKALKYFK